MTERCFYCGTEEGVKYCERCGHAFCPVCSKRYADRIADMIRERMGISNPSRYR